MAQVSYGTITVSDLTDITDVYLEYGLAVNNAEVDNDYTFNQSGERGWLTTYPTWTSGYQIWIRQVTEKEGLPNVYGTPYLDTAVNQINNSINQINNTFDTKLKYFWTNLVGSQTYPAGTYTASGNNVPFNAEDSSTYGYNTYYGNGIQLRYNALNLATLTGDALTFYQPPTISGTTTVQGNPTMILSGNALTFYNPNDGVTAAATLNSNGLNIAKGSITLGNNFSVNSMGSMIAKDGQIGGWSINSTSLYSLGKTKWDEDTNGIFIGNHNEENYFLTEDTAVVSEKTYYSYNKETDEFIEVENPTENINPSEEEYYEKETQSIFTISGGKVQYVKTDDITVNPNSDYYEYDETTGTYEKVENPTEDPNANPSVNEWYKSLGPMWYINSDGSASFGSLLVNQSGSLDVPAASISGKLTADQIEVNNLGAISANIGSTINSETTSNSFEINSEKKVVDTSDDRIIDKKEYNKIVGNVPYTEIVEESFINLKTQKNIYKLTTDSTRDPEKEYYEFSPDYSLTNDESVIENTRYYSQSIDGSGNIGYSLIETPPPNPKENNYYELHPKYELNDGAENPSSDNLYEVENAYSAGIVLQEGTVSILSNEQIVAKTSETRTNGALNFYNTELIGQMDIGNLRIMPYENGLVVRIGD